MKQTTAEDYLAQASLLRLLAVLALVTAPHLFRMPPWVSVAVVAIGLWRMLAALKQWPLPPRWIKVALVVAAFAGVSVTFGRISGQNAGSALLLLMLALKLTEMRSRRDVLFVVSLCYFVMITHFLFSQELWTVLYLSLSAVAITAILVEANHAGGPLPPRLSLRIGGVLVAQAAPLMVALFYLFPRIPGPLWGLPSDSGAARTGLSDSMAPGEISRLIQSEALAFRVTFLGQTPARDRLYWRGPVFEQFDGVRWSAPFRGDNYFVLMPQMRHSAFQPVDLTLRGPPIAYEISLEPHRQHWLFGLDIPSAEALPAGAHLSGYAQLMSQSLVKERRMYQAVSHTSFVLQEELGEEALRRTTRLPRGRNPRTVALAEEWRAQGWDDARIVMAALQMFREQEFRYTLEPPLVGREPVDEFLFETRQGFCEHYASSFTALMRAAGIPARVVTGYQGGSFNDVGGYYVVRQSDAHAWSEVWLPGRGWNRVDPTAAVSPDRIERGLSGALAESELPAYLRRGQLGLWYWRLRAETYRDMVNYLWDRWVIAYGPEFQTEFMNKLGLGDWRKMILALTVLITVITSLVGLSVLRRARPAQPRDRALQLWRRATRRLAQAGLPQRPHEGPRDYAARVIAKRPELAPMLNPLLRAYLDARYLGRPPAQAESDLAAALTTFRVPKTS